MNRAPRKTQTPIHAPGIYWSVISDGGAFVAFVFLASNMAPGGLLWANLHEDTFRVLSALDIKKLRTGESADGHDKQRLLRDIYSHALQGQMAIPNRFEEFCRLRPSFI